MALFPGIDFNYFEPLDQEKSAISFNQDSVGKAAGNFGEQYGDVAFDPTQFARNFAQKISQGYGAVDRALGGVLPGGADSPYVGSSTTAAGRKDLADVVITAAVDAFGFPLAHQAARNIYKSAARNPKTQISLPILNTVRQNVSNTLGRDVAALIAPADESTPHFTRRGIITKGPEILVNPAAPNENARLILRGGSEQKFGPVGTNVFNNVLTSSPTALHELGHALNTGDPFAGRLQRARNWRLDPETGANPVALVGGLGVGTSDKDGNKGLLMSGIQGALESMAAPGARHTLVEEALASKNAVQLANKFNLPRGIPQLGGAWGTYATTEAAPGFSMGVLAELGARGARALGNAIGDNIFDPIGDRIRGNDYNPLEQNLRKYGYDEKNYRLAQPGGFGTPVEIQRK